MTLIANEIAKPYSQVEGATPSPSKAGTPHSDHRTLPGTPGTPGTPGGGVGGFPSAPSSPAAMSTMGGSPGRAAFPLTPGGGPAAVSQGSVGYEIFANVSGDSMEPPETVQRLEPLIDRLNELGSCSTGDLLLDFTGSIKRVEVSQRRESQFHEISRVTCTIPPSLFKPGDT